MNNLLITLTKSGTFTLPYSMTKNAVNLDT